MYFASHPAASGHHPLPPGSFEDVMKEYMEDVLQPRSRASWDVIKAWFRAASARTESGSESGPGPGSESAAACGGQGDASGGDVKANSEGHEGSVGNGDCAGTSATRCSGKEGGEMQAATAEAGGGVECSVRAGGLEGKGGQSVAQPMETPAAEAMGAEEAPGKGAGGAPDSMSSSDASARSGECGGRGDVKEEALEGDAVGAADQTGTNGSLRPDCQGKAVSDGKDGRHVEAEGGKRWRILECTVADDGTCTSCGEKLQSIELSEDDEQRLRKQARALGCPRVPL